MRFCGSTYFTAPFFHSQLRSWSPSISGGSGKTAESTREKAIAMSEPKDYIASMNSDSRKAPVRVAFVTRRSSPHVKTHSDDDTLMTFPEALFRGVVAIEVLTLALVAVSLFWNA